MSDRNVLVADDDSAIRKMLRCALEEEGVSVFEVSGGEAAVAFVQTHPVDLVVLDIVMPEMDGIETLKSIKTIDETIEVLMITGHAELDTLRKIIFDYGAFDYLLKPFDIVELKVTVRRALRTRASMEKSNLLREELERRILELEQDFKEKSFRLRESQIKYRNMVENSMDAIVVTQDTRLIFTNRKGLELTGYVPQQILNRPFIGLIHPDDREAAMERYQKRLRGENAPGISTFRVVRKDGSFFWAEDHASMSLWGEESAVLHVMRDITERIKIEESLKVRDAALATSISGIGLADFDGNITYVNKAFCQMWGYAAPEDIIGKPFGEFFESSAEGVRAIKTLQERGGYVQQVKGVRKDRTCFDVQISASMVTDEWDRPICMMGSFLDITQQKRAEEFMMRTEKLSSLGQLSAGLAHELRNPLAVISSCSQFCLDNMDLEERVRDNFEVVYRNSQRAGKLISELLAFASPDHLETRELDINEVITGVLQMLRLEVDPSRISVTSHLKQGLPMIMGDREKLGQIFLNLVQNAIYAVSGKGRICLESRWVEPENMVEVSVIDNGTGIPEGYREKIFDPFFTTKEGGTGLGLSVCHSIVARHHGEIRVEPVEKGGTRMAVRLPAA